MEIAKNVHYVGVNDRTKAKFENSLSLPHGVSYNSYLIIDEKVALIDTVDICYGETFIWKLKTKLQRRTIDYLVINHIEPDHSGSIDLVRQHFPQITIVGNKTTLKMLEGFYGIDDNTLEINEKTVLSLGVNELKFFLTPMVHWPETMMSYLEKEQILFSGDAFGCFGTLDGGILDKELNTSKYWDEMYRYYANIIGKYGAPVQKAFKKLNDLPIKMIGSTHGPVWQEEKQKTMDIYDRMSRYEGEDGVVIVYGSMYGNTEQVAELIAEGLVVAGQKNVIMHNVSKSDSSEILGDIFRYKGLVVGSPTYCNDLYPEIDSLLKRLELRDLKNRKFGYFGSFSWAGAAAKRLLAFSEKMKWEVLDEKLEIKFTLKGDEHTQSLNYGVKMAEFLKSE